MKHMKDKIKGFTLIELMVVIAIIAMVLAYAIPNYRDYVLRSKRTEAKNALMQVSHLQERHYANKNRYGDSDEIKLSEIFPAPAGDNEKNYTISMVSTDTSYTITATAAKGQVEDTGCTTMTLNSLGVKTPSGDCWDR